MSANRSLENPFLAGLEEIRSSWGWFLTLGILLMICGAVCIVGATTATFVTVVFFGWLLIFGAVLALVQAFRTRNWSGFFLYFLSALLRGVTGYFLVRYPLAGAAGLTMILAAFFVVAGIFRAVGAGFMQFPGWGWWVFSGLVSFVLGILLLVEMPVSSIWFIGFAIGVDMIFEGGAMIGFAAEVHRIFPKPKTLQPA